MPDEERELYGRFADILHEYPEAEDALRAWRRRQAMQALARRLRRDRLDILVKCLCGHPPYQD